MNDTNIWHGASGKAYNYFIFPIVFDFQSDQDGNYIFCSQTVQGWKPIYIGEGDIKERTQFHIKDGSISQKGATHIHVHLRRSEMERKDEEIDLLNKYGKSHSPKERNVKVGG